MENKLKYKPRKNLKKDSYENLLDGVKIWTEYFRKNPHRFCMEWLGINLYWFQQVLLYMMNMNYFKENMNNTQTIIRLKPFKK